MIEMNPGDVVALALCPATDAVKPWAPVKLSGLFILEEFHPYEPAAYVHEDCWAVVPADGNHDDPDDPMFSVTDWDLLAQVDPHAYGRRLREEREMALAAEDYVQRRDL